MIKTDLDESIMVKLNNKGKGTSKKLLSEMKRNCQDWLKSDVID